MNTLPKLLAIAVFAALVAAPAAAQTLPPPPQSWFQVTDRFQVGAATLEPGLYLLKAVHVNATRLVLVQDADAARTFAVLFTTPREIPQPSLTSQLLYAQGNGSAAHVLTSWVPAHETLGYDFAVHGEVATTASTRTGVIVATR